MTQELRKDPLTAQKVDIGRFFRKMLGGDDAQAYLRAENVPETVINRVVDGHATRLDQPGAGRAPSILPPPLPVDLRNIFYGHSGRRHNVVKAAVVQAAIAVSKQLGRERATRLLQREDVPDDIIARVLADDGANRRVRHPAISETL